MSSNKSQPSSGPGTQASSKSGSSAASSPRPGDDDYISQVFSFTQKGNDKVAVASTPSKSSIAVRNTVTISNSKKQVTQSNSSVTKKRAGPKLSMSQSSSSGMSKKYRNPSLPSKRNSFLSPIKKSSLVNLGRIDLPPHKLEPTPTKKVSNKTDNHNSDDSVVCTEVKDYTVAKPWSPKIPDEILNVWSENHGNVNLSYDFSILSDLKWGKGKSCNKESVLKDNSIEVKQEMLTESENITKPKAKDTTSVASKSVASKSVASKSASKSKNTVPKSRHGSSKKIQVGNMVTACIDAQSEEITASGKRSQAREPVMGKVIESVGNNTYIVSFADGSVQKMTSWQLTKPGLSDVQLYYDMLDFVFAQDEEKRDSVRENVGVIPDDDDSTEEPDPPSSNKNLPSFHQSNPLFDNDKTNNDSSSDDDNDDTKRYMGWHLLAMRLDEFSDKARLLLTQ